LLVLFACLSLVLLGCGKKSLPRPPRRPLPPAVQDLSHSIQGDIVELKWTLPVSAKGSVSEPAMFKVLRAALTKEDIECKKCPIRFEPVAEIPILQKESGTSGLRSFSFTEAIESGYLYIYKVVAFDEYGNGGKDSNRIEFDY
jgi:hypothetical protein